MEETPYLHNGEHLLLQLQKVPFLKSLKDSTLRELLNNSKIRNYEAEEFIIREGMHEHWFYVILYGEVKILKQGEEIARISHTGEVFGESSIIDHKTSSASVVAAKKTYCLAINASLINEVRPEAKAEFEAIVHQLLTAVLAARLKSTSEELAKSNAELAAVRAELEALKFLDAPRKRSRKKKVAEELPETPVE